MNVLIDFKSKLRKMELKKHLIICWVLLLANCSGAKAISCYSCNTIQDGANCADPFVDGKVETGCKGCISMKGEVGGLLVVYRGCETVTTNIIGCINTTITQSMVYGDVCYCETDLCNSSSRVSMATMMVILLPVSVSVFMKLFQL